MRSSDLLRRELSSPLLGIATLVLTHAVFGPSVLYFTNRSDFFSPYSDLLGRLLAAAALAVACALVAIAALPPALRKRATSLLVALAVASWTQGNLLVRDYGVLDGRSIDWQSMWHRACVDGLMWASCLPIALVRPALVRSAATRICVALLVVQSVTLLALLPNAITAYSP